MFEYFLRLLTSWSVINAWSSIKDTVYNVFSQFWPRCLTTVMWNLFIEVRMHWWYWYIFHQLAQIIVFCSWYHSACRIQRLCRPKFWSCRPLLFFERSTTMNSSLSSTLHLYKGSFRNRILRICSQQTFSPHSFCFLLTKLRHNSFILIKEVICISVTSSWCLLLLFPSTETVNIQSLSFAFLFHQHQMNVHNHE